LLGWDAALDHSNQDDASELYDKGQTLRPYTVASTQTNEELSNLEGDDPQNFEE
jgi:Fe-S-cluster formation regulator IscX/YfhJ